MITDSLVFKLVLISCLMVLIELGYSTLYIIRSLPIVNDPVKLKELVHDYKINISITAVVYVFFLCVILHKGGVPLW